MANNISYKYSCPKCCTWSYNITNSEYREIEEDVCGPIDSRPGVINWDQWRDVICSNCKTQFKIVISGTWLGS